MSSHFEEESVSLEMLVDQMWVALSSDDLALRLALESVVQNLADQDLLDSVINADILLVLWLEFCFAMLEENCEQYIRSCPLAGDVKSIFSFRNKTSEFWRSYCLRPVEDFSLALSKDQAQNNFVAYFLRRNSCLWIRYLRKKLTVSQLLTENPIVFVKCDPKSS